MIAISVMTEHKAPTSEEQVFQNILTVLGNLPEKSILPTESQKGDQPERWGLNRAYDVGFPMGGLISLGITLVATRKGECSAGSN